MQKAVERMPALLRHASSIPETFKTEQRTERQLDNVNRSSAGTLNETAEHATNPGGGAMRSSGTAAGEKYVKLGKIGEGTYGIVYKAVTSTKRDIVALKKVYDPKKASLNPQEGIPAASLREIIALKMLRHPNIVGLLDIVTQDCCIYVVLEYMSTDLAQVLDNSKKQNLPGLPERDVMTYSYQMLSALAYCHARRMMHRDLKPQNILVEPQKKAIKIADFGLARSFKNAIDVPVTCEVVTLWYRAPEILLGCKMYTTSIDIWSTGFIVAEMISGVPFAAGDSEISQLYKIFQIFGTPSSNMWPGVAYHPYYEIEWPAWRSKPLRELLPRATAVQIDLIKYLCRYKPCERLRAQQATKLAMFDFMRNVNTVSAAAAATGDQSSCRLPAAGNAISTHDRRHTTTIGCNNNIKAAVSQPAPPAVVPVASSSKRHASAIFPDASVFYSTPEYSFTTDTCSQTSSSGVRNTSSNNIANDSGLGSSGSEPKKSNNVNNKRRVVFFNTSDAEDAESDVERQPFVGTDSSFFAGKRQCTANNSRSYAEGTNNVCHVMPTTLSGNNIERSFSSRPASRSGNTLSSFGSTLVVANNSRAKNDDAEHFREEDGDSDDTADESSCDLSLAGTDDYDFPVRQQEPKHQYHSTFLGSEGARDAIRERTHGLLQRSMSNAVRWPKDMLSTFRN